MKKLTIIPICMCLAMVSCKKSTNTTPTTPASTTSTPTPSMGSTDGGFVSLKADVISVTAGFPVTITTETGLAFFFTAPGSSTFIDGGTVSVNTVALAKQSNNSYMKLASIGQTPADLNFSSNSSNWSIGGAGSVPAFTYNDNATFPDFTGTVPDSITRSSGVTVSLSGKISNADSVILFVAQGSTSIMRTVAGSASSVSISASDLGTLSAVSNKSAVIEVIPYRVTLKTQGSKTYAFIKEHAFTKSINIY